MAANPTILPGIASDGPATVTEFGIPGTGRVDVLCVERDGALTICEVKLRKNPEIKREVLGQVLAYAAALTSMSYTEVDLAWTARANVSLAESVLGPAADAETRRDFEAAVARNLEVGRFRLVLVVDELTDELRQVIDYLGAHTDSDVDLVALEVAYAQHAGVEVLVPRAWGTSTARRQRGPGVANNGTRVPLEEPDAIVAAAEAAHPGAGRIVAELIAGLAPRLAYIYASDLDRIAEVGCVLIGDEPVRTQPVVIRPNLRTPGIRVCFDWMRRLPERRTEALLAALEGHPTLAPLLTEVRGANFRKRPLIPFTLLEDQQVLDLVIASVFTALEPLPDQEA